MTNKIASSGSIEGLAKLLKEYWFASVIEIREGRVFNANGEIPGVSVKENKGRYTAYNEPKK